MCAGLCRRHATGKACILHIIYTRRGPSRWRSAWGLLTCARCVLTCARYALTCAGKALEEPVQVGDDFKMLALGAGVRSVMMLRCDAMSYDYYENFMYDVYDLMIFGDGFKPLALGAGVRVDEWLVMSEE